MYKRIYFTGLIILLGILNYTCGAKKKAVSKSKTVENRNLVIQKSESISSETNLSKLVENISIQPADPTKPFETTISNGEEEITISGNNAKVLLKTETIDSTSTTTQKKDSLVVDKSQIESKEVNKNIESEGWNWKGLNAFLFLVIALIVIWYFFGKNRSR